MATVDSSLVEAIAEVLDSFRVYYDKGVQPAERMPSRKTISRLRQFMADHDAETAQQCHLAADAARTEEGG